MRWKLCLLHLLVLEQHIRGESLELRLSTDSQYDGEESVVFYTQGSSANLTCTLDGAPHDSYLLAWYYNLVPRPSNDFSLIFDSISLSDGGWYTCTTSLESRRYQLDFLLVVGGPPKLSQIHPVPVPYRVQDGARVEFPCLLQGTPWPRVEWFSVENGVRTPVENTGRFRISPLSQSLVIFNTTEEDLKPTYLCQVSNRFGDPREVLFNANITTDKSLPLSEPQFPDEDSDLLVATDDMTNGDNVELRCVRDGLRDGERVKWFRNGVELNRNNGLSVKKDDMGSGFYCCEVYSSNSTKTDLIIFDTRCVTLVFRRAPVFVDPLPLTNGATYHLPRGVKACVICRGSAKGPTTPPPFYDPPMLTWTGPSSTTSTIEPPNNFTDLELAYIIVDIQPSASGVYRCHGNNSVSTLNTTVTFKYIERHINESTSDFLIDSLAENGWRANGSADIATVMNERVFLLPFSTNDTIGDTWLSQDFTLTSDYSSFTISGRVRLSTSDSSLGILPVIQVYEGEERLLAELEHPERGSTAWQWVERKLSHSATTTYTIKLALKTEGVVTATRTLSKRQTSNMEAFFSDINVDAQPSPTDPAESNTMFIIIVASSSGGGLLAIILAVLLIVLCYFFCCRKGKDNARPMKKFTTLVKKKTKRYRLPSTMQGDRTDSQGPREYEIPLSSSDYATLKGTSNNSEGTVEHGEYTSINPQSLDEPSYYSTTFKSGKSPKEELDQGGVQMYLEVVPPIPTHKASPGSSRGNSPVRPSALTSSLKAAAAADDNIDSPDVDVLEGDSIEMYEYVNADLGPA